MQKNKIFDVLMKPGISRSILFGFFALLLMSFFITSIHIVNLTHFEERFNTLNKLSTETNTVLEIDKYVSELQRTILVFGQTEKNSDISPVSARHNDLLNAIEKLSLNNSFLDKASQEYFLQLRTAVEAFQEKIDALQSRQVYRDKLINTELSILHRDINLTISLLFTETDKHENKSLLAELWKTQNHLSNTEILSARYFTKHDIQMRKEVASNIEDAIKTLKSAMLLTTHNETKEKIQHLIESQLRVKATFHKAVQADRDYLFLANVVIAGESAEFSNLAEKLKNESIQLQHRLMSANNKEIHKNQITLIYLSVIGAVLAIATAVVIGKRISEPLQSITKTFNQLVNEETVRDIPGTERKDEIGQLAQAANVFRETNMRTQELLLQTEQSAQALMQREQALEIAVIKAQEASVAKSQFLANMSHELRTPMNAILGMLALLRKTNLSTSQADYAAKSEGAARSLLSLLNDILDISKAEAGKIELDPIPCVLDHIKRDLLVILSTSINDKPISLDFDIASNVPRYLLVDAMRLQQVLINLGSNAIKFTEQGEITIQINCESVTDTAARLHFSVKDSGIGIAPENQEKIFSGFTQAESSTTRRFGGTGLGLAISQHLVTLMGGQLSLTSQLGVGSCFSFSLTIPLLDAKATAVLERASLEKPQNANQKRLDKLKILLVEDNINNQQIATELLEAEGAILQLANHGQEALDILTRNLESQHAPGFDVVLMDLQMPVMDGLTATHAIRTQLNLTQLPIIAMTSNAMASDRAACLQAGMNEHLGKPFDLGHLIATLRRQAGWAETQPLTSISNPTPAPQAAQEIANRYNIDLKAALSRLGGKEEFYIRMLPKFIKSLSDLPVEFQNQIDQRELNVASRTMHSLKGIAATMGATELSAKAAKGEKLLLDDSTPQEQITNFVADICTQINTVISAMTELEKVMKSPPSNH